MRRFWILLVVYPIIRTGFSLQLVCELYSFKTRIYRRVCKRVQYTAEKAASGPMIRSQHLVVREKAAMMAKTATVLQMLRRGKMVHS